MSIKKETKTPSRNTRKIEFRVTEEEYTYLSSRAEESGCYISQLVRLQLFKRGGAYLSGGNGTLSSELQQKMAYSFCMKATNIANMISNFPPKLLAEDSSQLRRFLSDLAKNSGEMKSILNKYFLSEDKPELARIVANAAAPSTPIINNTDNIATPNFYYMQKITICGRCSAEAREFTTPNGAAKVVFVVTCLERNDQAPTDYDVFASKSQVEEILGMLTENRQVIVTGDFKFRSATNKKGNPQNQLAIWADTVVLGKEQI